MDRAFANAAADLDPRSRAWAREAAYGAVRLRGRLDVVLDAFLTRGVKSIEGRLLDVLRLGLYQLWYMGGTPAYAAVSESVELGRTVGGKGGAGLTNGVLRAIERAGPSDEVFPDQQDDPLGYWSAWGSHPRWLVRRWIERWGVSETAKLITANNEVPPLSHRPMGTVAEAVEVCVRRGWEAEDAGLGSGAMWVSGVTPGELLDALPGIIQDPAAALVTRYAAIPDRARVVDLCAAPGGKAIAAARCGAYVVAGDRSPERLRLLAATLKRLRAQNADIAPVWPVVADALDPPFVEVDVVLLDVPCTGTGTLRRHPDGRWRVTRKTLADLVDLQREMLDRASGLLPMGGYLVYSTCSLEPEENERQVASFLERNTNFEMCPDEGCTPELLDDEGRLMVLPQATGFDGAFGARLRRVR